MPRLPYRAILTLGLAALVLAAVPGGAFAHTPTASRTQTAPVFVFPSNGQSFPLNGSMLFQVQPMSGAKGYLWSFVQGGSIMYQNLAWDGKLGGATYTINKGSAAQLHLHSGPMQVWVRALLGNDTWSTSSSVSVQLQGSGGAGPNPQPTTKAGSPAPGPVLYQVDWSLGRNGWTLPQSWEAINSQLINDGTNGDLSKQAKPPISLSTSNYAVQADIQFIHRGSNGCLSHGHFQYGFGIVVRGDDDGYYALGVNNEPWAFIRDESWDYHCPGFQADNLTQNTTSLNTSWHTYRAEVRGNDIRLLIDGNMVAHTIDTNHLHGTRVALFDINMVIKVRSFKVIAL